MSRVIINRPRIEKSEYLLNNNTSFTELNQPTQLSPDDPLNRPQNTVTDFFNDYNRLFFEIPKFGRNSHESIILRSIDYIDFEQENTVIEELQKEIAELRRQLLDEQRKTNEVLQALNSTQNG